MKKLLLTTIAGAALLSSHAVQAAQGTLTHSPYIGLGAGWVSSRPDVDLTATVGTATRTKFSVQEQSPAGEVFLGWMFRYSDWHAALELGLLLASNNGKASAAVGTTNQTDISVKSTYAVNGAVRLGYFLLKDSLVYIRLGFENRNFDLRATPPAAGDQLSTNYRSFAFAPGIGFEYEFAQNFMLGGEFRTAFFQTTTKRRGATTMNVKPRTDTYLVRLTYKFKDLMK